MRNHLVPWDSLSKSNYCNYVDYAADLACAAFCQAQLVSCRIEQSNYAGCADRQCNLHMGGYQTYGPFLDPYYNTAPNIWGTRKGTIILTTTHMYSRAYARLRPAGQTLREPYSRSISIKDLECPELNRPGALNFKPLQTLRPESLNPNPKPLIPFSP